MRVPVFRGHDASSAAPPIVGGYRLASSAAAMSLSVLRDVVAKAAQPGVVSFALGMPDVELFPTAAFSRVFDRVLRRERQALQYGPPFQPLQAQIATLMEKRGAPCRKEQVFLTHGAQQGMRLLAQLLLDPGGRVLLEEIVYEGCRMAFQGHAPELQTVPTSAAAGLDVEAVEERLSRAPKPAFLYVIPDGHNPLGASLSLAGRARLVDLARQHQMPIIEDDAYGFLYYEQGPLPPLRALDDRWIFHLGSFSKILAPGLRVGWIVVPESLVPALSAHKQGADLYTANLNQIAITRFLEREPFEEHLAMLRREYMKRRDVMLHALAENLPRPAATWTVPRCGMYVWVELPESVDATDLLSTAIETEKVAFSPGEAFAIGDSRRARHCLRLSFANSSPDQIEDGIRRLGRALARHLAAPPPASTRATPPRPSTAA
jgi:2-aminoadipate transaminase